MPGPNLVKIFTVKLETLGIRYMITGGMASVIYGEPRLTNDVDIVLEVERGQESRIVDSFPPDEFYCAPLEVIRVEAGRSLRGHFNIIHHETGFKADIYLKGKDRLHEWALSKRKRLEIEGESIWVAPPEYVIIRKLEYYREGGGDKHLKDIEGILELSANAIKLDRLNEMIERYGLEKEWKEVKKVVLKR